MSGCGDHRHPRASAERPEPCSRAHDGRSAAAASA